MISNNRYCHDATVDHFIKINWGKYLRLYSFKSLLHLLQYQSPSWYTPIIYRYCRWQYMNFDFHSFILKYFLCIYFFQLMFYTLSIAVTAVFDFALSSLLRIMMLLHPSGRQSINLAPSSSWFQQIPFWFRGYTFWDLLDKYLMYLPPT